MDEKDVNGLLQTDVKRGAQRMKMYIVKTQNAGESAKDEMETNDLKFANEYKDILNKWHKSNKFNDPNFAWVEERK